MFSIYQILAVVSVTTSIFSVLAACDKHEEIARENDLRIIQTVRKILDDKPEGKDGVYSSAIVKKDNF